MKKGSFLYIFICIFVFILSCATLSAQRLKIDSLLILLKTDKQDTNRLYHLNKLSWEFDSNSILDSAIYFANSALRLSNSLLGKTSNPKLRKNIKKQMATSYNNYGNAYLDEGKNAEALRNYLDALMINEEIGDAKGMGNSYNNIGLINEHLGNYPLALKNHYDALKIRQKLGDKLGVANSYDNIGNVYLDQGNYPEALNNYLAYLKIIEVIGDQLDIADSYTNIGLIYANQGNYSEALKNHFASLKIYDAIGNKKGSAHALSNIGSTYTQEGNYSEGLKNSIASLKIEEAIGDMPGIATSYNGIGIEYSLQGNFSKALEYQFNSLKIEKAISDRAGMAATYLSIGITYTKMKKYKEALKYILYGKEMSIQIGYRQFMRISFYALTQLDSATGNFKSAFENHKIYMLYRDSLNNDETQKKMLQSQMTFAFEKKEAVATAEHKKELENQSSLADEKSRKQYIVIAFVVFGLLLVVVFAGFVFRSLRLTRKQKILIESQKNLVEEKQKEILDSIHYAKRIQQSLLPTEKYIERSISRLKSN